MNHNDYGFNQASCRVVATNNQNQKRNYVQEETLRFASLYLMIYKQNIMEILASKILSRR